MDRCVTFAQSRWGVVSWTLLSNTHLQPGASEEQRCMSEAAELWNICSVAMLLHPDFINVPWILTYYLRFGGVFNTVFAKLNKHNGYKDYDLCRFFCGLVLLAT